MRNAVASNMLDKQSFFTGPAAKLARQGIFKILLGPDISESCLAHRKKAVHHTSAIAAHVAVVLAQAEATGCVECCW